MLCEKPFTANAAEAREIAELAATSDRVVMEAFHYRYHPLALRIEEIIASGELGTLQRVEATLCFPLPMFSDIRYNYSLAGGATMDAGCYTVHMVRIFGGSTPEVVSAQAKLHGPEIDRAMTAELRFAGGHTGRIRCSMWSRRLLDIGPNRQRQPRGAIWPPRFVRVSARRFRRRGAARCALPNNPPGRNRKHDRHRCDLSQSRPSASPTKLKVIAHVLLTCGVPRRRRAACDRGD